MKISTKIYLVVVLFVTLSAHSVTAEELYQPIIGAGPSTNIVKLFVSKFQKSPIFNKYNFEVPTESAKHSGGILAADSNIFGRTGRPLSAQEKAQHKEEIFLAQIPITFVVGKRVGISTIHLDQLRKIFLGEITNWKDLGGPDKEIFILGREEKEAVLSIMRGKYSFFSKAIFTRVFKRDHEVVRFLRTAAGDFAIGFGVKPNFVTESRITVLKVKDFSLGVEVGLVYNKKNKKHLLVKGAKKYANSKEWARTITKAGYLPPTN